MRRDKEWKVEDQTLHHPPQIVAGPLKLISNY